jgi:hypothetical protein
MYIRKASRVYKGKTYSNYLLVESVLTPKGPRQRVVCSLGDLSPRPRQEWLALAHKREAALAGQQDLWPTASIPVPALPAQPKQNQRSETSTKAEERLPVRLDGVRCEQSREAGRNRRSRSSCNVSIKRLTYCVSAVSGKKKIEPFGSCMSNGCWPIWKSSKSE